MAVTKIGIHIPLDYVRDSEPVHEDTFGPIEFQVFASTSGEGYLIGTCHEDVGLVTWWRAEKILDVMEWMDENRLKIEADECEGHESLDGAHMGETVYCDGSCR